MKVSARRVSSEQVFATCRIIRVFRDIRNGWPAQGVLDAGAQSVAGFELMSSGIESQIAAVIASTLGVDEAMVGRDTSFAGDLGADSLDLVALILAIEDGFQVDIHDEDAAEILTVGQMIEYVAVALSLKTPAPGAASYLNSSGTAGLR